MPRRHEIPKILDEVLYMSDQAQALSQEELLKAAKEEVVIILFSITDVPLATEKLVAWAIALLRFGCRGVQMRGVGEASRWEEAKAIIDLQFERPRLSHEIFHPDVNDQNYTLLYRLETDHAR